MLFWSLALVVTAIACAALYYAGAGVRVNAGDTAVDSLEIGHVKLQLKEIDADAALGRLGPAEAVAARGEVARELMRIKEGVPVTVRRPRRALMGGAVVVTALLAFGIYGAMGRPDLPAAPLAERADVPPADMTLDDAIAQIEQQLRKTPDDARGWSVVAPAYMQMGRFADAANALRKVIALDGVTADRETDLGEALMMAAKGNATGEPMALFESAAKRDPQHARSRYYIAGELTRTGEFAAARTAWTELLALSKGGESWVEAAKAGLAAAEGGANGTNSTVITGMVEGLSKRLAAEGGSIDEWTRLVRSRLVLGQTVEAQQAYDAARAAYPDAKVRTEIDVLAADNGLVASN